MAKGQVERHIAKDGTISWRVRTEEVDPVTGKRKRPMKTFKTKREAEAYVAQRHTDIERGVAVDASKMSTGGYLRHWLETSVRPNVRPTTYESYEMLVRVHMSPAIGSVPLQKLTAMQIQAFYTTMLGGKRADGRAGGLSARTVRYTHTVLKKALKQAARWRLVPLNVAADVDPPKAVRPQIKFWTAAETQTFLAATEGDGYGAIWMTALTTGMRRSELIGLRWADVHLQGPEPVARVNRGIVALTHEPSEQAPKSDAGRRAIALSPQCVTALREHRTRQRERREVAINWQDNDLVFPAESGQAINPHNLDRRFTDLVQKAGVKRITFHGMRHTHATHLLMVGVNVKVVSERLGHASIQITLDTYAHVLPNMQQQAASAIDSALFGTA